MTFSFTSPSRPSLLHLQSPFSVICHIPQKEDAVGIVFSGDRYVKSPPPKYVYLQRILKVSRENADLHAATLTYLFPALSPLFAWFTDKGLFLGNTASLGPEGSGITCASNLQFDSLTFCFFREAVTPWGWPLSCSWGAVCWGLWDELLPVSCVLMFLPWTSFLEEEVLYPRSMCYSLGGKHQLWSHSGVVWWKRFLIMNSLKMGRSITHP